MYLEVYPDIIFILNASFDFILLYLLQKINRGESKRIRLFLGSMIGGIIAVIAGIFPWMPTVLKGILLYFVGSILMIIVAFGFLKPVELIKQWIILNLITYFIGGWIQSIYYHTKVRLNLIQIAQGITFSNLSWQFIVLSLAIIIPIVLIGLKIYRLYVGNQPLTYTVELVVGERRVVTEGLLDTGNNLYDPIYACPVIVLDEDLVENLLPDTMYQELRKLWGQMKGNITNLEEQEKKEESVGKFRWIPYHSIGKSGMMLGFQLDKIYIHRGGQTLLNEKITAAISESKLSRKSEYQVILHKALI